MFGYTYPHVLLGGKNRFLNRFFPLQNRQHSTLPLLKNKQFQQNQLPKPIWADAALKDLDSDKVSASKSKDKPNKCPKYFSKIRRLQSTSHNTLHLPSKTKDLSLLTQFLEKSASRRCSWCNSQLLIPKFRRAADQTVFIPSPTTCGENRLRSILALRGDCLMLVQT